MLAGRLNPPGDDIYNVDTMKFKFSNEKVYSGAPKTRMVSLHLGALVPKQQTRLAAGGK